MFRKWKTSLIVFNVQSVDYNQETNVGIRFVPSIAHLPISFRDFTPLSIAITDSGRKSRGTLPLVV
jgi:hypothetical protein